MAALESFIRWGFFDQPPMLTFTGCTQQRLPSQKNSPVIKPRHKSQSKRILSCSGPLCIHHFYCNHHLGLPALTRLSSTLSRRNKRSHKQCLSLRESLSKEEPGLCVWTPCFLIPQLLPVRELQGIHQAFPPGLPRRDELQQSTQDLLRSWAILESAAPFFSSSSLTLLGITSLPKMFRFSCPIRSNYLFKYPTLFHTYQESRNCFFIFYKNKLFTPHPPTTLW